MPKALFTQIEDKIAARLATVKKSAYAISVGEVQRPHRRDERSRPGGTVVLTIDPQGFAQNEDEIDSSGIRKTRSATFNIDLYIELSDHDTRPVTDVMLEVISELERAVYLDINPFNTGKPFGGLATRGRIVAPSFAVAPDASNATVRVRVEVDIRYTESDPYTSAA